MKIVVVGDIAVSCEMLEAAVKELKISEDFTVTKIYWPCETRQVFQKRVLNLEANGSEAEAPPAELYKEIEDADILLNHFSPVPGSVIRKGKKLKLIGTCRGGMEHIDVAAATQMRIPVIHVIRNAEATSDFAIGLIISETRNIARGHQAIKQGYWRKDFVNAGYTTSLKDMTLGLVGLGHIGKLVGKKACGLGMTVVAYDPYITQEKLNELGISIKLVDRDYLFAAADVVSLHLRATKETEGMINRDLIALMKPTAYLINTSRARVLDKEAFVDALANKRIGGGALDVFWDEPINADDPLMALDNLTMTPHIAGNVVDALPKSPKLLAAEINRYWETGKSDLIVNKI